MYRYLAAMAIATLIMLVVMPQQPRLVRIAAEEVDLHGGDHGARGHYEIMSEASRGAGFSTRPFSYAAIGAVLLNLLRFVGASLGLTARPRHLSQGSSTTATRGDSGVCTAEGSVIDDGATDSSDSQENGQNGELEVFDEVNREPCGGS
ncbi:uncharacterized protein LOC124155030 isoform X2 [Ischnura elegans]|uniref:uncharacterized protein LOC124155030 isoform X2 n=1 Tax=Ischnura elegans TaxID=197161 RepID=UPI001ED88BA4|nr:uncharacterized protein LOC124155030 isoform X2 [Ischnura elegans]